MRSRTFKSLALFLTILLGSCESLVANELARIAESEAMTIAIQHLQTIGKMPSDYISKLTPFGKSTWLVSYFRLGMKPSLPWRHVMNSRGEVRELTTDSLNVVFLNEFPRTQSADDRKHLEEEYIRLHTGESFTVLRSVSDIPGYPNTPIDPDIADAIRPPFQVGRNTDIIYTYQQIGGILTRYRFSYDSTLAFRRAEAALLGRGIGDARYYE